LKWGTLSVRVILPVTVTAQPNEKPRTERWIRNMQFLQDGETWKVYSESTAAEDMAIEVTRAETEEARKALLASDPDIMDEQLASALVTQGDRLGVSGNFTGALSFYQLAQGVGEQIKAPGAVALAHLKMGQLLVVRAGPKLDAVDHFQKALEGFTAAQDRLKIAAAERGLGAAYYNNDDQASSQHYKRALDILEAQPEPLRDKVDLATGYHAYGNACFMTGDYGTALDAYHRGMALLETAGVRQGIPALLQAIGRVQKEQRDYEAAVQSYEKSMASPADLDPGSLTAGTTGLADVYRLQGRFELSLQQYGKALEQVNSRSDNQSAMSIEADIGNVYISEQQPTAALDHYTRSLALAQSLNNQAGIARALAGSGTAYFADMRYEQALQAYQQSLALREKLNDKPAVAWTQAHIGLVQSALEKHEDALASYQKAYDLSTALRDNAAVAVMETLLARTYGELGQTDRALELAEKAAVLARAIQSDDTLAQALAVGARVLRGTGDAAGAERLLLEAVAAIESNRARNGDEPRDDFFGDVLGPYRAMALLQADAGKPADALLFAERSQLSLLSEVLTGNRSLIVSGLSAGEQEEERRLNREARSLRIQADKERQRGAPDAARLETLMTALADAEQRRTAFAQKVYADHPVLKTQRGLFQAASAGEIAALIPDHKTAIIEFVTSEKQALAIVLTKAATSAAGEAAPPSAAPVPGVNIKAVPLDIKLLDLARRVREFRVMIRERDKEIATTARAIYDLLLAPVAAQLAGRTRLVVVPDGPLWSLPFQALQASDGRFLIERAAVSYIPSMTVAGLVARNALVVAPRAAGRRVVAVGNSQPLDAADRLKLLNPSVDLKPVPNADAEARKLSLVYGAARTRLYAGPAVRTDNVRADARDASVLHLATFFVPSVASPMRSLFVLGKKGDGQADVLEACDFLGDALPPLIVVSRVQSERLTGEGQVPIGVAWVFLATGTHAVVFPTWPNDSPGAVSVMTGLHRALARPGAPAAASTALRQAILPLLATQYRHPFYWANFAIIGVDWQVGGS
jgi:CHAT domain-containing protein